jgi:hypothetical protein
MQDRRPPGVGLSGFVGNPGMLGLQALADLLGVVAPPGAAQALSSYQPTIDGAMVMADHQDASAAVSVAGTGALSVLTVPANQLWRVRLVAAERISGNWTMNKLIWRAPNGNEPIILIDYTGGRTELVTTGLDFWASPTSIFKISCDAFTSGGNVGLDVICDIFRLGPLPDLTK